MALLQNYSAHVFLRSTQLSSQITFSFRFQPQPKPETILTMAENTFAALAIGGDLGPHASCFTSTISLLNQCSSPLPSCVGWICVYIQTSALVFSPHFKTHLDRELFLAPKPTWLGSWHSAYSDRLVNEGWALLPGSSRYSRRFCYISLETTVPSISWLLVQPDAYGLLWLCSHPEDWIPLDSHTCWNQAQVHQISLDSVYWTAREFPHEVTQQLG